MTLDTAMSENSVSHYDLVEKIAEGGMGTVYKGRDQVTGEVVAVKIVPKHLLNNQVFLKRFEQEYNAARTLDHPNVVKALDFGRDGDRPFLVMEFVQGESLGARIEREGALAEDEAIRIISAVSEGLQKAHDLGLIHRDVKPDNILLTPDGRVKLTDMGLVKELDADNNLTRTGRGLGTPHFMAPEQFRNAKKADVRCDIYSLAATLYMMVTGELPFRSLNPLDAWMKKINNDLPPPRKVKFDVSEKMDWAIRRSMSADPNLRASSCREFIDDLAGQGTRKISSEDSAEKGGDWWYIVYKDEEGVIHTVKGTKQGIRRSLKENLFGNAENVRVARTKQGPFEPLRNHVEFRDASADSGSTAAPPREPNRAAAPSSPPRRVPNRGPVTRTPGAARDAVNTPVPADTKVGSSDPSGPVLFDLQRVSEEEEDAGDWGKYFLFMLFGMSLGVLAYLLVLRAFPIR